MSIKVKICGVTNMEDATWAINLGASFIGFNFWSESQRKISEKNAKEIIAKVPPFVSTVGVFVDSEAAVIEKMVKKTGIQYVQLHGNENTEFCQGLKSSGIKIIKVFRIKNESDIQEMFPFVDCADYFLVDTYVEEIPGGTGQVFDWNIAVAAKEQIKKPFFLAGGLTSENVIKALEKVLPFGVDVCSGIEKSPRRKDYDKMKEFLTAVNEVF